MARTGRFGRLPRAAPDLSGAIASLLREMQNQEDSNFISAWQNGGEVGGRPVTDQRLLAHFRKRRDQLDKDDPLWDEWDNRITQYGFTIEQSKMQVKYDQGKASDREMAAFYQRWGRKAPPNSEFGRTLASAAAKFLTASKQKKTTQTAAQKQAAHDREVQRYYDRHVKVGEQVGSRLLDIAKLYGAAPQSATSLDDLNPDSEGYGRFMDIYSDGRTNDPYVQGLIDDVEREARRVDPSFRFDKRHIDSALAEANHGLGHLVRISIYKTEREEWQDRRGAIRAGQNDLQQAPIIKRVFDAQDQFNEQSNNCDGDPVCERRAAEDYLEALDKQGRKLMRGGSGDVDLEIVSAIAQTTRTLNAALDGKPLDPAKATGGLEDLNGSDRGVFAAYIADVNTRVENIEAGGWLSSVPVPDGNGGFARDEMGDVKFDLVVHHPDEPVPVDLIGLTGDGIVEGGARGTRLYVSAWPVAIQYVAPDGSLIDSKQVLPAELGEDGKPVLDEATPAPQTAYTELRGIVGPDHKTRTTYMTGTGAEGDPVLFHATVPEVLGPGGQPIPVQVDANGNPVVAAPAFVTQNSKGETALAANIRPYVNAGEAMRTPFENGNLPLGTFHSLTGASHYQVVNDLYDTGRNLGAALSMPAFLSGMLTEAARLGMEGDTAGARGLIADAEQLSKASALRARGLSGTSYDDYYEDISSQGPELQEQVSLLNRLGITEQSVGVAELARRARILRDAGRIEASKTVPLDPTKGPPDPYAGDQLRDGRLLVGQAGADVLTQQRGGTDALLMPQIRVPEVAAPLSDIAKRERQQVAAWGGAPTGPSLAVPTPAPLPTVAGPPPSPGQRPPMVGARGAGPVQIRGLPGPRPAERDRPRRTRSEKPTRFTVNPQPFNNKPNLTLPGYDPDLYDPLSSIRTKGSIAAQKPLIGARGAGPQQAPKPAWTTKGTQRPSADF